MPALLPVFGSFFSFLKWRHYQNLFFSSQEINYLLEDVRCAIYDITLKEK